MKLKWIAIAGLMLIMAGAYFTFRKSSSPLSSEAQITRELDQAESALEARSAPRLTHLLSEDFRWGDNDRKEFNQMVAGAFWQWRDVELTRTGQSVTVSGDNADARGTYVMRYRPSEGAAVETHRGNYVLHLRLEDGEWKVAAATGGENAQ